MNIPNSSIEEEKQQLGIDKKLKKRMTIKNLKLNNIVQPDIKPNDDEFEK